MSANILAFLPFRLDPSNVCLWRGAKRIALPPKDFAVLHYLVTHAEQIVTHAEILKAVWPDTIVSPKGLKAFVRRLREVLGDKAAKPRFIETVHRRGYRFIGKVVSGQYPGASSPFPAAPTEKLVTDNWQLTTSLVGRAAALAQLHGWLEKARNGQRQIVFVTGEPGIGKTTAVAAFVAQVATDPHLWVARGQCVEQYGTGEPYLPVLEALGRLCRGPDGKRLLALLRQHAPTWLMQMPALLNSADVEVLQPRVLGATRERMLREFAEAIEVLTAERTLILVLEDLHWSDVSTLEALAVLARRPEPAQVLVIGTYRPLEVLGNGHPFNSMTQELHTHGLCSELALGSLSEGDVVAYLEKRFPQRVVPMRLATVLHQRTEGNPLFLVSVVSELITRGALSEGEEGWVLPDTLEEIAARVPENIRQLVARQRERLRPEEQSVLEAASIAGQEFSAAAVAAALATEVVETGECCGRLAERQQFLRPMGMAEWPDGTVAARYGFVHALYQHLWHERVSIEKQRQWHLRVGERKEAAYGAQVREIAAELAVHFEQGRDYRRAIHYLQQAGENALRRSAYTEAITHFNKGLALLQTLPDTSERTRQELGLQIALSTPLIMTKGYGAAEVETTCSRAYVLCRQVEQTSQLFPTIFGLFRFHMVCGNLRTAQELGKQLLELAQHGPNPDLLQVVHTVLGAAAFHLADWTAAYAQLEQGLTRYDPHQHRSLVLRYGDDTGVICLGYMAWLLQMTGYPDQAQARIQEMLSLTRKLSHPLVLAGASWSAALFHQLRREGRAACERAEAAVALGNEEGSAYWITYGATLRGWALATQGQTIEGIGQIERSIHGFRAIGVYLWRPYILSLLAEAYGEAGQAREGLSVLTEALAVVDKTDERLYEAELYRLKGQLTLQLETRGWRLETSPSSPQASSLKPQVSSEAKACFLRAIEIARQQRAKSFELRAVMSLARLWQQLGKHHEARNVLSEIYGWFTEGFDTQDLQEARALLTELS